MRTEKRPRALDRAPKQLSTQQQRNILQHSKWLKDASDSERSILHDLTYKLGLGIDYRSMAPAILSQVYEQALVDDDIQHELGIYYTPPALAARMLDSLPVELIDPKDRHVLDPACGSGTLLVAAHGPLVEAATSRLVTRRSAPRPSNALPWPRH